ncbi:MAG: RNA 2',3'-cyclic phosphodiesterase [Alphaproteobacteria bacterium]
MVRLFVGLEFDADVQARLATLTGGVPGARWVQPPNFHLTLRFVGEIGHDTMDDLDTMLAGIAAPAFDLSLMRTGYFGSPESPRMLWIGTDRNSALAHLQSKIESAIVRAGLPPEPRKFIPHVTLARLRHASGHDVTKFMAERNLFRIDEIPVRRFTLFSSFLAHSGAIHTPEAHYELDDPVWAGAFAAAHRA